MPVKETFVVKTTPGIDPILFDDWLAQQSLSEQQRYYQSRARADLYRQAAIDAGLIIHVRNAYIWRDEEARKQGKRQDDECMDFYNRFNADTGRKLVSVIDHINE